MTTRIYVVEEVRHGCVCEQWLVDAPSRERALRLVLDGRYTVEPANPKTVARLMQQGIGVLDSSSSEEGEGDEA